MPKRLFDPADLARKGMALALQCGVSPRTYAVLVGVLAIVSHACEDLAVYGAIEEWAHTLCPEDTAEVLRFLRNNDNVIQKERTDKSQWN